MPGTSYAPLRAGSGGVITEQLDILPGSGVALLGVNAAGKHVLAQPNVIGEIPAPVSGSNHSFVTAFDFIPESVEVYINGLRQTLVIHFNTHLTTNILLVDDLETGDTIIVNYERQ